eukprot:5788454-Pyramimonas_sp.AAC.1
MSRTIRTHGYILTTDQSDAGRADGGICGDSPSRVQENKEVADERGLCVDLPIDGEKGSARPLSP